MKECRGEHCSSKGVLQKMQHTLFAIVHFSAIHNSRRRRCLDCSGLPSGEYLRIAYRTFS